MRKILLDRNIAFEDSVFRQISNPEATFSQNALDDESVADHGAGGEIVKLFFLLFRLTVGTDRLITDLPFAVVANHQKPLV